MNTPTLKERMRMNYNKYRTMPRRDLVLHIGLVGAISGLAAWLIVLVLAMLFDLDKPGGISLLLAIPRGAIFGIILALVLHAYWNRGSGDNETQGRP